MATDVPPEVVTVAINRADGGMTVKRIIRTEFWPLEDDDDFPVPSFHRDVTPEFIEAELAKRPWMFANNLGWEIVPEDYIDENTEQTYRNAWKHTPGQKKPGHDMIKAKEIHRANLRIERMAELDRLDTAYMLADERGDVAGKQAIAAEKAKFRDVTADPRIEAAQTVEELLPLTLKELVPETQGIKSTDKMRVR